MPRRMVGKVGTRSRSLSGEFGRKNGPASRSRVRSSPSSHDAVSGSSGAACANALILAASMRGSVRKAVRRERRVEGKVYLPVADSVVGVRSGSFY